VGTSPFSIKGKGEGMVTSPFSLKGKGEGMSTSPFSLKGFVFLRVYAVIGFS
jgi:hypothetical protein